MTPRTPITNPNHNYDSIATLINTADLPPLRLSNLPEHLLYGRPANNQTPRGTESNILIGLLVSSLERETEAAQRSAQPVSPIHFLNRGKNTATFDLIETAIMYAAARTF